MKKTVLVGTMAILLLVGTVAAFSSDSSERFLVSGNPVSGFFARGLFGVQHEFANGFTTQVTPGQLRMLRNIPGIELETVPLYHITGKPVCDYDDVCEPELGENPSCADCKNGDEEPPPEERTCYPSAQIPYGIGMVNGGSGGAGVTVAVLDTGVKKDHLDLVNRVKQCKDFTKGPRVKNGCADNHGHGTHVSGTVLADGGSDGKGIFGVAPEADLFAYKVCGDSGCWTDDIAAAIRYAAGRKANIISMSLGGNTESSLIKNAIDYAIGKGVLVVAAAGNDGPSLGSIDYPGANVKAIAVGAIDSGEGVPSWSSRGINDGDYVIEQREVEFGAPGVAVESTLNNGCYSLKWGTSMATPHISGLAAKLWQGSASATRAYLQNLARNHDLFTAGDDPATGFGLPIAP